MADQVVWYSHLFHVYLKNAQKHAPENKLSKHGMVALDLGHYLGNGKANAQECKLKVSGMCGVGCRFIRYKKYDAQYETCSSLNTSVLEHITQDAACMI